MAKDDKKLRISKSAEKYSAENKINNKRKKGRREEVGPSSKKNKSYPVVEDERFQSVHYDPIFQNIPKKESKVEVDSRFDRMFTAESFGNRSRAKIDKRGKIKEITESHLTRYYVEGKEKKKYKGVIEEDKKTENEERKSKEEEETESEEDSESTELEESSSSDDDDEYDDFEDDEEVDSSSPGTEVSRLQVWEKTHKKKDGSTSDATSSFFDKIEKEKETTSGGDEDVFITVFGKDVKGRSRSIGTNIAPSQVKGAGIPCKRLKEAHGVYEQRLQNVEQKLMKLDNINDKLERLLSIAQDNRQVGSEIGTSQFATPTNQLIDQRCEILNFEDEVIATGTICRDSTALLIHGKPVPPTYEKVVLDEILLPDELTAKICRQFTETFGDVGVGGYVSHQKGLIRYL